jgi:hypothetical protein
LINHFPEFGILLKCLVFAYRQTRTVEKILQGIPVEDPVHDDAKLVPLEIDAVVIQPESVQGFPMALELSETLKFGTHHLLRHAAELSEDVQLQFPGHPGQLRRARRIEYDLEWPHWPQLSIEEFGITRNISPALKWRGRPGDLGFTPGIEGPQLFLEWSGFENARQRFGSPLPLSYRHDWQRVRESNPSFGLERATS